MTVTSRTRARAFWVGALTLVTLAAGTVVLPASKALAGEAAYTSVKKTLAQPYPSSGLFEVGDTVYYKLSYKCTSSYDDLPCGDIHIYDVLAPELTFVSVDAPTTPPAHTFSTSYNSVTRKVDVTINSVGGNQSGDLLLSATINARPSKDAATDSYPISNTATSFGPDTNDDDPFAPPPTGNTVVIKVNPPPVVPAVLSLGDLVWVDANKDGQFDQGESPISGVTVTLLDGMGEAAKDAGGNTVAATTTDADGRYQFSNLLAGSYRVQFTRPSGYVWTVSNSGGDGLDSDATYTLNSDATATTATFTLSSTAVTDTDTNAKRRLVTDPTIDAGVVLVPPVVPTLSLGDLVWIDANKNGQFDQGELPISGVTVTLLDGTGAPAKDAGGNTVLATTTDVDGRYQFSNLLAGSYRVQFTRPSGYVWTVSNTGGDGLDSDPTYTLNSDATATTATFTLSSTAVTDTDTNAKRRLVTDPTIDAGVVPVLSLGDLVWIDANKDGQFQQTESPISKVKVDLFDGAGTPAKDAQGNAVASASTDVNGRYQFSNLLPGEYRVQFTLPTGYVWTTSNTGGDGLDSDAVYTANTDATAMTDKFTLSSTAVTDTDTNTNRRLVTDPTIDAGVVLVPPVVPTLSLGDLVWIDANKNGQFDQDESPISKVKVDLLDGAGQPAKDAQANPVASASTDVNGRYQFSNLLAGEYRVQFTLPAGYVWTTSNTGGDGLDSDAVYTANTDATATTNKFTLSSTAVTDTDTNTNRRLVTDPTIDAGVVLVPPVVPTLSLGDLVWIDADKDGQFDQNESPILGVTVTLLDGTGKPAKDAGANTVLATTTDVDGRYQFSNLLAGSYQVQFTLPTGYVWTVSNTGDNGLDSDATYTLNSDAKATTEVFSLESTAVVDTDTNAKRRLVTDPTIDAGVLPVLSLGDLVWIDANKDGQFQQTESPISKVKVDLLDGAGQPAKDAQGNAVASASTDVNGRYQFSNLLPGEYRVQFTLPTGYVWTVSNTGGDGLDSDAMFDSNTEATAMTDKFTLSSTAVTDTDTNTNRRLVTDPTIDAGVVLVPPVVPTLSLGDLVWIDANKDGQFQQTESPIAKVKVELLDGTGAPAKNADGKPVAATSTDVDGRYQFDNLLAGEYRVRFTLPTGYVWTVSNTGGDGLDSDATYSANTDATATTNKFTLSSTAVTDTDTNAKRRLVTDPTIDAGVVLAAPAPTPLPDTTTTSINPGVTTTTVNPGGGTTSTPTSTAPQTSVISELPRTGGDIGGLLSWAFVLLVGGGAILLISRRRPETL